MPAPQLGLLGVRGRRIEESHRWRRLKVNTRFMSSHRSTFVHGGGRAARLAAALFVSAFAALLLGCGSPAADPTATAAPTVAPTAAPVPTTAAPAAVPTATPVPTAAPTPTPALFPFTVTGTDGREIVFDAPPERIVAIDSAVVEILFAIGEGHRVAATHDFVSYPPETEDIPRIGDAFNLNNEAILALDPDLVFVFSEGAVADLERVGLRVLYLQSLNDDLRQVPENIRLWGRIVGNPQAADAVASDFEDRVARIEDAVAAQGDGPSVFQDVGGLWTPGPDTLIGSVFDLLKMRNIAHDISGYAQISPEIVVERGPDIILASDADAIAGNPAFADVPAVKNGRIFASPEQFSVPGPRYIDGVEALAKWAYPEVFR